MEGLNLCGHRHLAFLNIDQGATVGSGCGCRGERREGLADADSVTRAVIRIPYRVSPFHPAFVVVAPLPRTVAALHSPNYSFMHLCRVHSSLDTQQKWRILQHNAVIKKKTIAIRCIQLPPPPPPLKCMKKSDKYSLFSVKNKYILLYIRILIVCNVSRKTLFPFH